jgi:hypothetical protein
MLGFPLGILSAAGAGGVPFESDYELISTTILDTTAASVTFSSLGDYSAIYKHLQVRMVARTNRANNLDRVDFRLNGDTASNYSAHELTAQGSVVSSGAKANITVAEQGYVSGGNNTADAFGSLVSDILDPYSTTKNTTLRGLSGFTGGDNYVVLFSANHRSTAAVSSILIQAFGGSYLAGSRFSLYGIKG